MKRNKIYLLGKLNQHELDLFKLDLLSHFTEMAFQIKNLKLDKNTIELLVKNAIEIVMAKYKFDSGNNLGELIKTQVIGDLRAEYQKRYPTKSKRVKWPDSKKIYASRKLYRMIQKLKTMPKDKRDCIINEVDKFLTTTQKNLFLSIYTSNKFTCYQTLSEKLGIDCITVSNEIIMIHLKLNTTLKNLGIDL